MCSPDQVIMWGANEAWVESQRPDAFIRDVHIDLKKFTGTYAGTVTISPNDYGQIRFEPAKTYIETGAELRRNVD